MELRHLVLSLLISGTSLFIQASHAEQLIFPFLTLESQSNIIVTANFDHPKLCPPDYTNLISNTNFFSIAEQRNLKEAALKYKDVTTNSGPAGSVFKGWGLRQEKVEKWTNTFWVACFTYTNSDAQEEIRQRASGYIVAKFRTRTGNGYNVSVINGSVFAYQEYKNGLLNGLYVILYDPSHPEDKEHCGMWARFLRGKILGKFLMWGQDNKIVVEAEFLKPFDFLKYGSTKLDLEWTEVPTNGQVKGSVNGNGIFN
jgi:hypothetical protein